MSFNPLEHRGIPLDHQTRNWRELRVPPIDPDHGDAYTPCRISTMNGIETEAIIFGDRFTQACPDSDVKRWLSELGRIEQEQRKSIHWLLPGRESALEAAISHEWAEVDLTAGVARMEPDPHLKQAFELGALEEFDHLCRFSDVYALIEHRRSNKIVDQLTAIMPDRPGPAERRPHQAGEVPEGRVPEGRASEEAYERHATGPMSRLHALTIMASDRQLLDFFVSVGAQYVEPLARPLYEEIGHIEEEHVPHYESLVDPGETWWEGLVHHEYNECYLYHSFLETETDPQVKAIWELLLNMELEHLRVAYELMRRHDGRDPESVLPAALPLPITFEPNEDYLRSLLAAQVDPGMVGAGDVHEMHDRFEQMQNLEQVRNGARDGEEPSGEREQGLGRRGRETAGT